MRDVAARALECLGTPFRHQGRLPGVGIDCLGLIVHAVHGEAHDVRAYHKLPDSPALEAALGALFEDLQVDYLEDAPTGAVVSFASGARRRVRHLGIRTDAGMVHADARLGVVELSLCEPFLSQFHRAHRYRWHSSP